MTDEPHNPADPRAACAAILQQHRNDGGRWPAGMPKGMSDAVEWWLNLLEPPHELWDRSKQVSGPGGDRWVYPYVERVTGTLRRFLRAGHPYQSLIVAAAEDGIPWRGDDEWFFRKVIAEHERMRDMGIEAYKRETLERMKTMFQPVESEGEQAAG